jgi:hypothetical protein
MWLATVNARCINITPYRCERFCPGVCFCFAHFRGNVVGMKTEFNVVLSE